MFYFLTFLLNNYYFCYNEYNMSIWFFLHLLSFYCTYSYIADVITCNKKICFLATTYIFFFIIIYHESTTFYKSQGTVLNLYIHAAVVRIRFPLTFYIFRFQYLLYFSRICTTERNNTKLKYDIINLNLYWNQNLFSL